MTTSPSERRALVRGVSIVCVAASLTVRALAAQQPTPTVTISAPGGDTLASVTPTFAVSGTGLSASRPLRIRFQLDTSGRFVGTLQLDTTLVTLDSVVTIAPSRALPEDEHIFYRATITDPGSGFTITSGVGRTGIVPKWVTPITPRIIAGQPVRTRTPRFTWRSPQVNEPPGPWEYLVTLKGPDGTFETPVRDTVFVPNFDLQANSVYTWTLAARLPRVGQQASATQTFVVEDTTLAVVITDLYAPFPSPFPSLTKSATCIWFDLKSPSAVALDVYDLRGVHVRRLAPSGDITGTLAAGRYGRGRTALNEGCDGRFAWDGTDDHGNTVPEGVYTIRFRAGDVRRQRKVLFLGRR